MDSVVHVDGSYGEGGGQVLRTSLTLSTLTGRPARVHSIRAGRSSPGLAPQHLTGVLALADVCGAEIDGARIGSTEVLFHPKTPPRPDRYAFDVASVAKGGSAGSVTLLLQALLVPLALAPAPSQLRLTGGTHVAWSPPFHYIESVYLPALSRMGIRAECSLDAWGFYPKGGGRITVEMGPGSAADSGAPHAAGPGPLTLTARGELKSLKGVAVACNLSSAIAQRMANRARNMLGEAGIRSDVAPLRVRGTGPGAAIVLVAEYEETVAAFSALGERGKPADKVAEEAIRDFLHHHESGAPVDMHLADQLLLPMSLAMGRSEFRTCRITRHLLTNKHVIGQFLPATIDVQGEEGAPGTVIIDGAGTGREEE